MPREGDEEGREMPSGFLKPGSVTKTASPERRHGLEERLRDRAEPDGGDERDGERHETEPDDEVGRGTEGRHERRSRGSAFPRTRS
jgi:hypothetical protein